MGITNLQTISLIRYQPKTVFRLWVLAEFVEDEIYPVALEMLDGSYWKESFDPGPPEYGESGSFEVGGGD